MCNLYSLNKNKNTVATMFRVAHNRTVHIDPLPGIFPNYTAPVVRHAGDGEREMALMSWGFPLLQAGKAPRRVTNVRDDKILTSWNGMTIGGLARASRALERDDLAGAAVQAMHFLRARCWKDGRLLAVHTDGESRFPAYLDDYAMLAWGLRTGW